jgi:hypothetical protein
MAFRIVLSNFQFILACKPSAASQATAPVWQKQRRLGNQLQEGNESAAQLRPPPFRFGISAPATMLGYHVIVANMSLSPLQPPPDSIGRPLRCILAV